MEQQAMRAARADRLARVVTLCGAPAAVLSGVVVSLGPSIAVLLTGALAVGAVVLMWRRFDLLLHLLLLSVFVESVGVGPVRVGRVLAVVALAAIAGRLLFTTWRPARQPTVGALTGVTLFGLWAWSSGLWASDSGAWAYAMGQLALAGAYFLAFVLFVERVEQIRALLRTYVLGAVFASAVAFVQVASGDHRAEGLQGDPNIYALYQVAALPAAAMLAATAVPGRRRLSYAAIPVLLASVLATQSRGGLLTALLVLLLLLVRGDLGTRLRRHRTAAVTIGLTASVAVIAATTTLNQRFAPDRVLSDRGSGRFDIWYVAFREWQDHGLLGVGGGGFKPRSVELLVTEPGVELIKSHLLLSSGIEVHNIYLETLVEYGVVGCALFLTILISTGWLLVVAARGPGGPVLRALPMIYAAFLAGSFFLSVVNNKLLWTLIALGVVLSGRVPLPGSVQPEFGRPVARDLLARLRHLPGPLLGVCGVVVLLTSVSAAVATAVRPPFHTASTQFVVSTVAGPLERETTVRTLEELATSQVVARDVQQRTGVDLTPEQISDRLLVVRPEGALTFTVVVYDTDLPQSRALAEGLVAAFPEQVRTIQQPDADGGASRFSLQLWAGGQVTSRTPGTPVLLHAALGLFAGAGLASVLVTAIGGRARPARTSARGGDADAPGRSTTGPASVGSTSRVLVPG